MNPIRYGVWILGIFSLFSSAPVFGAAGEAARTLVRGGCPDSYQCCNFGDAVVKQAAPVYDSEDAVEKVASLPKGKTVKTEAGRVETTPGRIELLQDYDQWKKGDLLGLYSEPTPEGKTRIGLSPRVIDVEMPFLAQKKKCSPPSKECWAKQWSAPKVKWWIKVKLDNGHDGWVESKYFEKIKDC